MVTVTITQRAEDTEQQLIDMAAAAVRQSNWTIGEAASKWTELYASGRTDEDFAELIGSSRQVVNYARRVYDRFCPRGGKHNFAWREWKVIVTWPDADECLDWAEATSATFGEMNAWRNMKHGEQSRRPVQTPIQQPAEPQPPIAWPTDAKHRTVEEQTRNEAPVGEASPATRQPPAKSHPVAKSVDLKQAASEAIKALRQLASGADIKRKRATAGSLRRLADEFDPPATDIPPRVELVESYCEERENGISAEAFWDFYQSKGWKIGKDRMRDWQAAVRNAERGGYFQS